MIVVVAPFWRNCKLPETGWGELLLKGSRPEVGSGWTDDGKSYEERGLKAEPATRRAPCRSLRYWCRCCASI